MEKVKIDKRLISPNKINLPISVNENGILDEYIQTNDKNCQEIFTCSICSCLAWDPVCCPKCDKPFCRACLIKYGKNKRCPFKCESYSFREITRNEKNYLNKIKIKCTNVGCSKYIPYSEYLIHLEKCQLRKYHCKNQSCKEEGYFNDMINHSKNCPYRLVECGKCKQNIKFSEMKIHQQEICPEIIVKCKLCGISMKRGIYNKEHKSENNENVKCLKLQVEKWKKIYNEDINNKNKEILELKNKIKELEKSKRNIENENSNNKKNIEDIKQYLKNGFNKFFGEEKIERKNENALNMNDSFSKEFLSTESSFFSRNNNKIIYKHNSRVEKKNFKITVLNKHNRINKIFEVKENNDKEDLKDNSNDTYLKHIKKVQSLDNCSNYNSNTYSSSNPFK